MMFFNKLKSIFILFLINCVLCDVRNNEIETNCALPEILRNEIAGYQNIAQDIINEIVYGPLKGKTWEWLAELVDTYGSRMSGSAALESAIDHMVNLGKSLQLDNVYTEDVEVPHWVRGSESVWMKSPRVVNMPMLGLGGSVGTSPAGIIASIVVVENFDELNNLPDEQITGKIVVYNPVFISYGETVQYRSHGAAEAAKRGAKAALVRSITPKSIRSPHTGWQYYEDGVPQIPVACITIEDAELLHRMYKRGTNVTLHLTMAAQLLDPAVSRNTILELVGNNTTTQRSVVVVSGHLDSWDIGDGAMDDGGGAMISVAAVAFLRKLNLHPRRTIRAILWTAEEQGLVGSQQYADRHVEEEGKLNFVMESDSGTFKPLGLDFTGSETASCILQEVLRLLKPINATLFKTPQDGGPDISHWTNRGIPGSSLLNENERYFWYHHSAGDSMTVEDPHNLDLCAAVWTIVSYVIADLEHDIPRK